MDFGKMIKKIKPLYVARTLIILYIAFISLFSLDTPLGLGFLIHLLPTIILVTILIATWKFPKIAGILFILAGLGTILVFNTYRDLFVLFAISIIPVLVGILFLLSKNPKH